MKAEKVWNKIFPLKVGDRVKVISSGSYPFGSGRHATGKIGTIIGIRWDFEYPYRLRFDHEKGFKRDLSLYHVYKREELEIVGRKEES